MQKIAQVKGEQDKNKSLFENGPRHIRDSSIWDEEDCSTEAGGLNGRSHYGGGNIN